MDKETSDRVSSLAALVLKIEPVPGDEPVTAGQYNVLLEKAKTLAGCAMSQDQTPGQKPLENDL